jgi:hypothetical protein
VAQVAISSAVICDILLIRIRIEVIKSRDPEGKENTKIQVKRKEEKNDGLDEPIRSAQCQSTTRKDA